MQNSEIPPPLSLPPNATAQRRPHFTRLHARMPSSSELGHRSCLRVLSPRAGFSRAIKRMPDTYDMICLGHVEMGRNFHPIGAKNNMSG